MMNFMKRKGKNDRKIFGVRIFSLLILGTVLFTSIGFSAFWQTLNITNSLAEVRLNENVRVTNFDVYSTANSGGSTYEEYNVASIMSGLVLPYDNSTVTYKMEVTNFIGDEFGIFALNDLPSNLEYRTYELVNGQLVDYNLKSKICDTSGACNLGIKKDIYVTIKYKDGGYDGSNTTYALNVGVDFRPYYTVTYVNITNNGYPVGIFEGDTLKVTFTGDIPRGLKILSNGEQINNYTYANGILTLNNVMGNIAIEKDDSSNIVTFLTNLYKPDSTVTSNKITYNVDRANGIIDDGLGGKLSSGGNLRYFGANPNNYIDIGDRDSNNKVILWRIIGVFDTKYATDSLPCNIDNDSDGHYDNCASEKLVKIIRNDSIGNYSWDYTSSGGYDNNWNDSTLQVMLNNAYYNSGKTSYYNDSTSAISLDFASSGLSSNVHSKIEKVLWNLGGVSSAGSVENSYPRLYSDGYYKYERDTIVYSGRLTEWVGKVGLMYLSDYVYATDFNLCVNKTLEYYYEDVCRNNVWLFNSSNQWSIIPYSNVNNGVTAVCSGGYISFNYAYYAHYGARPVLYLKSNVALTGEHTGNSTNPYVLE